MIFMDFAYRQERLLWWNPLIHLGKKSKMLVSYGRLDYKFLKNMFMIMCYFNKLFCLLWTETASLFKFVAAAYQNVQVT